MSNHPLNDVIHQLRRAVLPPRDEMTDGELLAAFLEQRDEAALATLVRRHGPLVWGVCHRVLRHQQETEDAFQATFLLLVRRAATIRDKEKVAHWLYRVAHQTALRARAMAARKSVRERQVAEMPEPAPAEQDFWSDLRPLLDQELNRLPDQYGVVIVLCDLEGQTRQDVARRLGCPEGTIASRLARARALLAKRLARHGLAVSIAALAAVLPKNAAAACVPTVVMSSTIRAASLLAAGQAAGPAVISTNVAALTEGVLRAMLLAKLKIGLALLLVAAVGLGLVMHVAVAQPRPGVEHDAVENVNPARAEPDVPQRLAKEPKRQDTLRGHTGAVVSVAFSPDGQTLASASYDMTLKLWDVTTGQERATVKGHKGCVGCVAFSPDGKTLASAVMGSPVNSPDLKTVKLWDAATGNKQAVLEGHTSSVLAVAFSPDGKSLASGSFDRTVKLWSLPLGKDPATLQGHTGSVHAVAFSSDGKTLASGSNDQTVKLWDVATGKERATLQGHTAVVGSVAFSSDGKTLASASHDGTVKLWDVAAGKERATFLGHTGWVTSVAFSPDSKTLASASQDKTIKLWDVAAGKERAALQAHTDAVQSVAFSPDGKTLASASKDQTVKLWDLPATKKTETADARNLSGKDLDGLWTALAGDDAAQAYRAIRTLVGVTDQAVLLVKERLRPALEPDTEQITPWISDLASADFEVRQKASRELEKLGEQTEAALRAKLAEIPELEVQRRIESLLTKLEQKSFRSLRAIEMLEYIGNSEAKEVLETLATGAEGARLTREAKAALDRLDKQAAATP